MLVVLLRDHSTVGRDKLEVAECPGEIVMWGLGAGGKFIKHHKFSIYFVGGPTLLVVAEIYNLRDRFLFLIRIGLFSSYNISCKSCQVISP